jgi:peptidoglycan/xylan/chitin deacetylase (PgdA/CDA1 family)
MTDRAALSVDFELFRHTPAYRKARGHLEDDTVGLGAVDYLLESFDRYGATATFFVVSEVLEEHSHVVERIADAGHEIASHTHTHRLLNDLSRETRLDELTRSRRLLAEPAGTDVVGFRAPAFDFPDTFFAELIEAGYEYDSSVSPCRRVPGFYGGDFAVRSPSPATVVDPSAPDGITEVPIGVSPRVRLPVSGAWVRLLGRRYSLWGTRRIAANGVAPVLYVHPWEFVDLPDVAGVPWRVTWRTGKWMRTTLERLLSTDLEFVTVGELASDAHE